jgi:uncharacterized protein (AIM24 family)
VRAGGNHNVRELKEGCDMPVPVLKPTAVTNESFAGVTYHIEGELVPVLHLELSGERVYFEHNILLWKDPSVEVTAAVMPGAMKRVLAGMPVFVTEAKGNGRIAFSRDGAGHVFAIHMKQGDAVDVREHQFLAATHQVGYTYARVKGMASMLFGGTGFFIDTFRCAGDAGVLWLHGYGNVFEVQLAAGEVIDVEPGAWLYKSPTVKMDTILQKLSTSIFSSAGNLTWNRFTGPGALGFQSYSVFMATE